MALISLDKNKPNKNFEEIIKIIENLSQNAFKAVNRELINMLLRNRKICK